MMPAVTAATSMEFSPPTIAGSVNFTSTANDTASAAIAPAPRQRPITRTNSANAIARLISGGPRWKSLMSYWLPAGWLLS